MAVLRIVKEINGRDLVLGVVCQSSDGSFWFNPKMAHRARSRKKWPTATAAIPRWANNMADRIDDLRGA